MDWEKSNEGEQSSNDLSNNNKNKSFQQTLKEQFNIKNSNNKKNLTKKESESKLSKRSPTNDFINTNKNLANNANLNIKGNNNKKITEFDIENFSITNSVYICEKNDFPNEEYKLESKNDSNLVSETENKFNNRAINNIIQKTNLASKGDLEVNSAKRSENNLNEEENNNILTETIKRKESSKLDHQTKYLLNSKLNEKGPSDSKKNLIEDNKSIKNNNNNKDDTNHINIYNNNENHLSNDNCEDTSQTKALKSEYEKKLKSFLKPEIFQLMNSSKWEERKKGFIALNESINDSKIYSLQELKNNFEDILNYMKIILKNFKEKNFNIIREAFLCYADLAKILSLEKIFDKKMCGNILKEIWEKLPDSKLKESLLNLLLTFMEYFSPNFVITTIIKNLEKSKSVNLLKEYSNLFEKSIEEFGISNIPVKEIVNYAKILANNSNAQVRAAAISLLGALYRFIGSELKALLIKDIKESTLKVIVGELDKVSVLHGTELSLGMQGKRVIKDIELLEQQQKGGINGLAGNNNNKNLNGKNNKNERNNFLNLITPQDISKKISKDSKIVKDINEGKWVEKKEAFESLDKLLIESSNKISSNGIQDFLLSILKPKFSDGNKQLVRLAIQCFSKLIVALGPSFRTFSASLHKNMSFALLANLSDKMQLVREDVISCLDKCIEFGGLESVLPYLQEHLGKNENYDLRNDLLRFLLKYSNLIGESVGNGNNSGTGVNYFKDFVGPIVKCLLDKVNVIRNLSEEFLEFSLNYIPLQLYYDNIKDFKPAIKDTLKNVFGKYLHSNDNNTNNFSGNNINCHNNFALNNNNNSHISNANCSLNNSNNLIKYGKRKNSGNAIVNLSSLHNSLGNMDDLNNNNHYRDTNVNSSLYNENEINNRGMIENESNQFNNTGLVNVHNKSGFSEMNLNNYAISNPPQQNFYSATSIPLQFNNNIHFTNNTTQATNAPNCTQTQTNLLNSNYCNNINTIYNQDYKAFEETNSLGLLKLRSVNQNANNTLESKLEENFENRVNLNNQIKSQSRAKPGREEKSNVKTRVRSQSRTQALIGASLLRQQQKIPSREDSLNLNPRKENNFKQKMPKNASGNDNNRTNISRNTINNFSNVNSNKNNNISINNTINRFDSRCDTESNSQLRTRGPLGGHSKQRATAGNFLNNKNLLDNSNSNMSKTQILNNCNLNNNLIGTINNRNMNNNDIHNEHSRIITINDSFNNEFNISKNSGNNMGLNKSNQNYNSIGESENELNANLHSNFKINDMTKNKANRNTIQVSKLNNNNLIQTKTFSSDPRHSTFVSKIGNYNNNTNNLNRENSQNQRLLSNNSNKNLLNLSKLPQQRNLRDNNKNINKADHGLILRTAEKDKLNSITINNENENESEIEFYCNKSNNNQINKKNFASTDNKNNLRNSANFANSNQKKIGNQNKKVNMNMNTISIMTPSRTSTKSALSANQQVLVENKAKRISTKYSNYSDNNLNNVYNNNDYNYTNSEVFNANINLKFSKEKRNEIEKREKINLDSTPTEEYIAKLKDYLRLIFQEEVYFDLISEDHNKNLNILYFIMHKINEASKTSENTPSNNIEFLKSTKADLALMFENLDIFLKWIFWRFSNTQNPVFIKGVLEFFGFLADKFSLFSFENTNENFKNYENNLNKNNDSNNIISDLELNETEAGILLFYLLNNQCVANSKTKNTIKNLIFKFCGWVISLSKAYSIITNFITSPNKNQKLTCEALDILTKIAQDFGFADMNPKEIKLLIKFSMLNNIEGIFKAKINGFLTTMALEATEAFLTVVSEFDINTKKILLNKFKTDKRPKKHSAPSGSGNLNFNFTSSGSNFTNYTSGCVSKISNICGKRDTKNSFNYVATSDNEVDFKLGSSKGLIIGKFANKNSKNNKDKGNKVSKKAENKTEIHNQSHSDFSVDVSGIAPNCNFNNNNNCFNDSSFFINNIHSINANINNNKKAEANNVNLKSVFFGNSGSNEAGKGSSKKQNDNNSKFKSLDSSNFLNHKKFVETNYSNIGNENVIKGNDNAMKINNNNNDNSNNFNEINYDNEVLRTNFDEKEKDKTNFYIQGSFTFKQDYTNNNNLFESIKQTQNRKTIPVPIEELSSEFSHSTPKKTLMSTNSSKINNVFNNNNNNNNSSYLNIPNNMISNNNINFLLSSAEFNFSDSIKNQHNEAPKIPSSGFSCLTIAEDSFSAGAKAPAQATTLYKLMDEEDLGILGILDKMDINLYNQTLEALVQLLDIIANKYEESKISLISNLDNIFEKFLNMLKEVFREIDNYTIEKLSVEKINVTKYLLTTVYRIASKRELVNYALLIKISELFEILLRGLLIENSDQSSNHQQALIIGYSVNSIILKLLENFDYTKNFEILFDLIMKYRTYESKAKIVSLSMKCLLKLVQILEKIINEIKLDQIFYKIHFLIAQIETDSPGLVTSNKLDLIIIKFLKNVVFEFAKIKSDAIITEYIKFVEKIEVKDKFIKQWIKEYMNNNSTRNAKGNNFIKNKEEDGNSHGGKFKTPLNSDFRINENIRDVNNKLNNNCVSLNENNINNEFRSQVGSYTNLNNKENLNRSINDLRIENNFNNNAITNNDKNYSNSYNFHIQNDGQQSNTSQYNLSHKNELQDKKVYYLNETPHYKASTIQSSFTDKSEPLQIEKNWDKYSNQYKHELNFNQNPTADNQKYYSSSYAHYSIQNNNTFTNNDLNNVTNKSGSNPNVLNNYYNEEEYKHLYENKDELGNSNLKFGSEFFNGHESINNVNTGFNNGANRIQVTKYYK